MDACLTACIATKISATTWLDVTGFNTGKSELRLTGKFWFFPKDVLAVVAHGKANSGSYFASSMATV